MWAGTDLCDAGSSQKQLRSTTQSHDGDGGCLKMSDDQLGSNLPVLEAYRASTIIYRK
jgi:hypothetical protein